MQTILAISAIVIALIYLGREFYKRFFAKETKCDGCAFSEGTADIR